EPEGRDIADVRTDGVAVHPNLGRAVDAAEREPDDGMSPILGDGHAPPIPGGAGINVVEFVRFALGTEKVCAVEMLALVRAPLALGGVFHALRIPRAGHRDLPVEGDVPFEPLRRLAHIVGIEAKLPFPTQIEGWPFSGVLASRERLRLGSGGAGQ